jgi:hypothetical protein
VSVTRDENLNASSMVQSGPPRARLGGSKTPTIDVLNGTRPHSNASSWKGIGTTSTAMLKENGSALGSFLRIFPPVLEFKDIEPNVEYFLNVTIQNRSKVCFPVSVSSETT